MLFCAGIALIEYFRTTSTALLPNLVNQTQLAQSKIKLFVCGSWCWCIWWHVPGLSSGICQPQQDRWYFALWYLRNSRTPIIA